MIITCNDHETFSVFVNRKSYMSTLTQKKVCDEHRHRCDIYHFHVSHRIPVWHISLHLHVYYKKLVHRASEPKEESRIWACHPFFWLVAAWVCARAERPSVCGSKNLYKHAVTLSVELKAMVKLENKQHRGKNDRETNNEPNTNNEKQTNQKKG